MKIPKYWAKSIQTVKAPDGSAFRLVCWQWSDTGPDEARQKADDRVRAVAQRVIAGAHLDRYGYGERPLREEIVQAVTDQEGRELAVITRNQYGALVLNTDKAMFIDIDFAEKDEGVSMGQQIQRLLGVHARSLADQQVERIARWASQYPDLGIKVYRTFAGLRCLVTNQLFEPGAAETIALLQAAGSDPLYVRLCQAQACFRARLTPKPWRCDMDTPPTRYPWENSAAETDYREWQQRYERAIPAYSVCKFVKQLGPTAIHPEVEPILKLHDQLTGSGRERQLA